MAALHLLSIASLTLGACYSPELHDCVVTCSATDDCVGGQVCGNDGFCIASDMPGRCAAHERIDAAVHVDAVELVAVRVMIMGHGKVVVATIGECNSDDPTHGDCTFMVPRIPLHLLAEMISDKHFKDWTTANCNTGTPGDPTCTFTPVAATTVGARFE